MWMKKNYKHLWQSSSSSPIPSDPLVNTELVDFHAHALAEIDDGARTIEESKQMLIRAKRTGISYMVLTPHFYADTMSLDEFLTKRSRAWERISAIYAEARPKLFLGAEVAYFASIGKSSSLSRLCITGTNVLLLEMPYCEWCDAMIDDIAELVYARKLQVVLAHIERYFDYGAKKYLQKLLSMGVFMQFNAEALLDKKTRKKSIRLLKKGMLHLMGSDAHRAEGARSLNFAEGVLALRELVPEREAEMAALGKRLLRLP